MASNPIFRFNVLILRTEVPVFLLMNYSWFLKKCGIWIIYGLRHAQGWWYILKFWIEERSALSESILYLHSPQEEEGSNTWQGQVSTAKITHPGSLGILGKMRAKAKTNCRNSLTFMEQPIQSCNSEIILWIQEGGAMCGYVDVHVFSLCYSFNPPIELKLVRIKGWG